MKEKEKMKQKTFLLLNVAIFAFLLLTFFLPTIPVPVELKTNLVMTPLNKFISSLYWTSGLYQLKVGNYLGMIYYFSFFAVFFIGNKLSYKTK